MFPRQQCHKEAHDRHKTGRSSSSRSTALSTRRHRVRQRSRFDEHKYARYGGASFPEEPRPRLPREVAWDTRSEIRNERLNTDAAAAVTASSRFFPSPTTSYGFMLGCTHDLWSLRSRNRKCQDARGYVCSYRRNTTVIEYLVGPMVDDSPASVDAKRFENDTSSFEILM